MPASTGDLTCGLAFCPPSQTVRPHFWICVHEHIANDPLCDHHADEIERKVVAVWPPSYCLACAEQVEASLRHNCQLQFIRQPIDVIPHVSGNDRL